LIIIKKEEKIWETWPSYRMSDLIHDFTMVFYDRYNRRHDYGTGELYLPVEMHILETIYQNPGITVSQVALLRNRTKSAISQTVKKLEKRGLVMRTTQGNNRRNISLWATDEGKRLTKMHIAYDNERFDSVFGQLPKYHTTEELNNFFSVMETAIALVRPQQSNKQKKKE
jgi:DNA-binding MarR family transcriptional regulator